MLFFVFKREQRIWFFVLAIIISPLPIFPPLARSIALSVACAFALQYIISLCLFIRSLDRADCSKFSSGDGFQERASIDGWLMFYRGKHRRGPMKKILSISTQFSHQPHGRPNHARSLSTTDDAVYFCAMQEAQFSLPTFMFPMINKYRGGTSDATTPSSLIGPLFMSFDNFLLAKTAIFVVRK